MKKKTLVILILLSVVLVPLLYVAGAILYGTITDYQPEEHTDVAISGTATGQKKNNFSLLIWNIGYSGLGAESDFFYDGGKMVVSPQPLYENYFKGIFSVLEKYSSTDFILLQEVDLNSDRSYRLNQHKEFEKLLSQHQSVFAHNYKVNYIPIPLTNPMGKVEGGLASYSKIPLAKAVRHQFPGNYSWPKRIFFLDRCFLSMNVPLENGKELIVINTHNSAYDDGGLKAQQMAYLKDFLLQEYKKGNYVIVGGDWNQCPPNFAGDQFYKTESTSVCDNISEDYLPSDWQWVYDSRTPTNRELATIFDANTTNQKIIDFYLTSPNIETLTVKGEDIQFAYSDHQPVYLEIQLKQDE